MIDCWVKNEALVERKYGTLLIEVPTELRWIHCVVVSRVVVSANCYLLHVTILLNRHQSTCANNQH